MIVQEPVQVMEEKKSDGGGGGGEKSKSVKFFLNFLTAVTCEILYIGPHPHVDVSPIGRVHSHLDGFDRVE